MACEIITAEFPKTIGSIEERLTESINIAHEVIKAETGDCKGLFCSLSLVAWQLEKNKINYVNIADSRIFRNSFEQIVCLTVDDAVWVARDPKNPLEKSPVITKALGQREELEFEVKVSEFKPGESLIVATDGIFGHLVESLNHDIVTVINNSFLPKLDQIVGDCSGSNNDDASLIVLRRKDHEQDLARIINDGDDFRNHSLFQHQVRSEITNFIKRNILASDWEGTNQLLKYISSYSINLDHNSCIELLDLLGQQSNIPKDVWDKLLKMTRKN